MRILGVRIWITTLATLTAVIALILVNVYPTKAPIFFGIEVLLLPAIYIVGNYCIENSIKKEYLVDMENLTKKTEKLQDDLEETRMNNVELSTILDINFGLTKNATKKK